MDRATEFAAKQERLRAFMDAHALDGVLLRTRANIAWLGSGPADKASLAAVQGSRSEVWHQADDGVMAFVVTRHGTTLVTENIELPRLSRDEFPDLPLDVHAQPWHESDVAAALRDVVRGDSPTVAADLLDPTLAENADARGVTLIARPADIAALRASLLPRERERYRWLGQTAAQVLSVVCRSIRSCTAEVDVVADAHHRLRRLGIAQEVDIVCADGRLWQDRHALYGDYRIERLAMVTFCAHKWGLVANLTRMVHLGPVPPDLAARHCALAAFDRRLMEATQPGVALRDLFAHTIRPGYADLGEPDAWRDHHQGGSTGYTGRDQRVTPTTEGIVQPRQAFAWNPSLPGVKSEDTFVVGDAGPEVLTVDPTWPVYPDSGRPAILALDGPA